MIEQTAEPNLGASQIAEGCSKVKYFDNNQADDLSLDDVVANRLSCLVDSTHRPKRSINAVLFGFGRIGRLMASILMAETDGGNNLRLCATIVRKGSATDD